MKRKLVPSAIVLGMVAIALLLWAARDRNETRSRRVPEHEPSPTWTVPNKAPAKRQPEAVHAARGTPVVKIRKHAARPAACKLAENTGETKTGSLRVIVTDEHESPVAGAQILLLDYRAGSRPERIEKETGVDGQVVIAGLPPGRKQLSALALGWRRIISVRPASGRMLEVRVTIPRTGATVEGVVTEVGAGPLAGLHLSFTREEAGFSDFLHARTDDRGYYRVEPVAPGRWRITVQRRAGVSDGTRGHYLVVPARGLVHHDIEMGLAGLEGTVVDARTGAPIGGASIQLFRPMYLRLTTGEDGIFRFLDLPDGPCAGNVRREGYQSKPIAGPKVEKGRGARIEIALEPAITVPVRLLDRNGRPLLGRFYLHAKGGDGTTRSAELNTDADGRAVTKELGPGKCTVYASGQGLESEERSVVLGETKGPLEFRLAPKKDPRAQAGEPAIIGTVTDASSREPVDRVRVSIDRGYWPGSIYTDARGGFTLRGLAPGKYTLQFIKAGHGFHVVRDVGVVKGRPTRLAVQLQPAATLRLQVSDAQGMPVAGPMFLGVHNVERNKGTNVGTSVTANGEGLALFRSIVPGTYDLYVKVEGRGSVRARAEILPGDNLVDVRLRPQPSNR